MFGIKFDLLYIENTILPLATNITSPLNRLKFILRISAWTLINTIQNRDNDEKSKNQTQRIES